MATFFVFGNAPTIIELLNFTGKDESTDDNIMVATADDKWGHSILNINGHMVGVQVDNNEVVKSIYAVKSDGEGLRLLTILIEQWSEENTAEENDIATTVVDDDMGSYLESI
jgi:hypothetical protein